MIQIVWVYGAMSVLAFATYGLDKRAAIKGLRRVPEARLHLLELFGGWPGALAAQQVFRHKRRKLRFLVVTWAIVALHLALLGAWLAHEQGWIGPGPG